MRVQFSRKGRQLGDGLDRASAGAQVSRSPAPTPRICYCYLFPQVRGSSERFGIGSRIVQLTCTLEFAPEALDVLRWLPIDPLDRVTLSSRVRTAAKSLADARGLSNAWLSVFKLETASGSRSVTIYGCIVDRLLVEFTRIEIEQRSWRWAWLGRKTEIRLKVVSLTLLPFRSPR